MVEAEGDNLKNDLHNDFFPVGFLFSFHKLSIFNYFQVNIFVVVLLFVGDNSFMRSTEYRSQINELKGKIKSLEDSANRYDDKVNELNTDNESLEHLVREKYGMKRVNEEVYITDIP